MATFTRDQLSSYEKGPVPTAPAPEISATPASDPPPVETLPAAPANADGDSSPPSDPPQDDPANDGSIVDPADPTPAIDPDNSPPENDAAAPRGKSKAIPYERFQEVVDERNAMRKYGDHLLATIAELKQQTAVRPAPAASAPAAPVATDEAAPTLEQFDYDAAAHSKAQNEWLQRKVSQGIAAEMQKVQAKTAGEQAQAEAQQIQEAYTNRVSEFKKTKKDFDAVVSNPNLPRLANTTARAIVTSEQGAALTYYFATHVDVATRVAKMSAEQQLVALGRIEAEVSAPMSNASTPSQPTRTRTVTQAPPPPRGIPAGSTTSTKNVADGSMSMNEFVQHEREKKMNEREVRLKMRGRRV